MRIEIQRFCKELLRSEGRTVGRLDSRYTGFDRDSAGEEFEFDPAMVEIYGHYAAAMNDYVRTTLKFEADLPYEIIKPLYPDWGWKDFANRFASIGEDLRKAMTVSSGDPMIFVQRPISLVLLILATILLIIVAMPNIRTKREEAFQEG